MGGLSYGTSENRGYGGTDAARDDYGRASSSGGAASSNKTGEPQ
jgi:hypothetical protein